MPSTLKPISRNVSLREYQLQQIFTSPINEAIIPVENKFIKKIDFLPKTITGNLDFDISTWISEGLPLD
jgi:hypothetical protein